MTDAPISLHGPYVLGAPPGRDGKEVSLQATETHIQWRLGSGNWANLVPLDELTGEDGREVALQTTETHIQWRLAGDDWANLVALVDIKGDPGEDGDEVSLQATATHIQWRLGAGEWVDLVSLDDLQGGEGAPGPASALTIGEVTTLAPGENATAEIDGIAPNFTLSLGLPKGAKGDTGDGGDVIYESRTSDTAFAVADRGKLIAASGTFTQTFAASATLQAGWWIYVKNTGTGVITLDPNGTEMIDGLSSIRMYPGEGFMIQCDGTKFTTVGRAKKFLIGDTTVSSSVAAVDFESFSGDAETLQLEFEVTGASAQVGTRFKKGGAYISNSYSVQTFVMQGSSSNSTSTTSATDAGGQYGTGSSLTGRISGLEDNGTTAWIESSDGTRVAIYGARHFTNSPLQGIRFFGSTNFTSGRFTVWGVRA